MLKFFAEKRWVAFAVQKLLTFFQQKYQNTYIESAKTVNEMTLNEFVKLTTLWTTGPRWFAFCGVLFGSVLFALVCASILLSCNIHLDSFSLFISIASASSAHLRTEELWDIVYILMNSKGPDIRMKGGISGILAYKSVLFNPCPAEPGYTLPLQTVWIQIGWLLKKPAYLDLHCLPLIIWIYSNNPNQVIWFAEN